MVVVGLAIASLSCRSVCLRSFKIWWLMSILSRPLIRMIRIGQCCRLNLIWRGNLIILQPLIFWHCHCHISHRYLSAHGMISWGRLASYEEILYGSFSAIVDDFHVRLFFLKQVNTCSLFGSFHRRRLRASLINSGLQGKSVQSLLGLCYCLIQFSLFLDLFVDDQRILLIICEIQAFLLLCNLA
jgi:hypothetical protein